MSQDYFETIYPPHVCTIEGACGCALKDVDPRIIELVKSWDLLDFDNLFISNAEWLNQDREELMEIASIEDLSIHTIKRILKKIYTMKPSAFLGTLSLVEGGVCVEIHDGDQNTIYKSKEIFSDSDNAFLEIQRLLGELSAFMKALYLTQEALEDVLISKKSKSKLGVKKVLSFLSETFEDSFERISLKLGI